jgi:hypothetical protein
MLGEWRAPTRLLCQCGCRHYWWYTVDHPGGHTFASTISSLIPFTCVSTIQTPPFKRYYGVPEGLERSGRHSLAVGPTLESPVRQSRLSARGPPSQRHRCHHHKPPRQHSLTGDRRRHRLATIPKAPRLLCHQWRHLEHVVSCELRTPLAGPSDGLVATCFSSTLSAWDTRRHTERTAHSTRQYCTTVVRTSQFLGLAATTRATKMLELGNTMPLLPRPSTLFQPGPADDYRFSHFPSPESLGNATPLASCSKQLLPVPAMYPVHANLSLGAKQPWWGRCEPLSLGQSPLQARTAPLDPVSPSSSLTDHLPPPPPALAKSLILNGGPLTTPNYFLPQAQPLAMI